jgi:PBP1b-binding outer membrane lipoprotein LpoB
MNRISTACIVALLFSACANGDSDNVSPEKESSFKKQAVELKQRSVYEIKPDNTYVELNSGKAVKLQYNEANGRVTEQITNREIDFFVDETTQDTVDATGQVVNNTLRKTKDGSYEVVGKN